METARNLRADAFAGTADAYLRHRRPYPPALLDDLVRRAGLSAAPVLLDLASGPGRVALDLAARFEKVVAIDLEPEMIAAGQAEAARRGIGNVAWRVGRAEDATVAPASADLITIGEAFHRLDQAAILAAALRWLRPGGCLAILGADGLFAGDEAWKATLGAVARRWTARAFPGGVAQARPGSALGPDAVADALRGAGFVEVQNHGFVEPQTWSFEAIVGWLRSTSICSEKALGAAFADFEDELRAALGAPAAGIFHEAQGYGYILGRRAS
jgi:SAM-dependent methyltransferase